MRIEIVILEVTRVGLRVVRAMLDIAAVCLRVARVMLNNTIGEIKDTRVGLRVERVTLEVTRVCLSCSRVGHKLRRETSYITRVMINYKSNHDSCKSNVKHDKREDCKSEVELYKSLLK